MNDENVILCDNGCCVSDADCFSGCECLTNVRCQWVPEYEVGCCFADAVPPSACDDGNPCTFDSCDPGTGGGCVHELTDCDDLNECTIDTCIEVLGQPQCVHEEIDCDDGNPCTFDSCDHLDGCKNDAFSDAPPNCSPTWPNLPYVPPDCAPDGNDCTWSVCDDGACVPVPPGEIELYGCALTCEPDGNPCTDDFCDGVACVHPNRPLGEACNLAEGADPCTIGQCDGSGQCVPQSYVPDGQPCPGLHDPPPPCKTRVCQAGACVLVDVTNGTWCPDESPPNACTTDICQDGVCVHAVPVPEDTCSGGWYGPCYVNTCELGYCAPEPRCDEYGGYCTVSECFTPHLAFVVPGSVTPENPEGVVHYVHGEPTPAPLADDRTFVTGSLVHATPTSWRAELRTTRYAGPVSGDVIAGPLEPAYREQAILARSLEPIALLTVHYFGIDCEQFTTCSDWHFLLWNNEPLIGRLLGECDRWSQVEFEVPIELVKFPAKPGLLGVPPKPAVNTLDVLFTGSSDCRRFAWASLSIRIMSPLILVHGNGSDSGFFERQGFVYELDSLEEGSIPCVWNGKGEDPETASENSLHINQDPKSNSIVKNTTYLKDRIPGIATSLGVDSVHLVVHSKGGLDTRSYLAGAYSASRGTELSSEVGLEILSFSSLSTPHDGSIMASLIDETALAHSLPSFYPDLYVYQGISIPLAAALPIQTWLYSEQEILANRDLTPPSCSAFNSMNAPDLPRDIRYWTYGGDADLLRPNGRIDPGNDIIAGPFTLVLLDRAEYYGLQYEDNKLFAVHLASRIAGAKLVDTLMYQPVKLVRSVKLSVLPWSLWGTIVAVPLGEPKLNDTLVTIDSAKGLAGGFVDVVNESGGSFLSLGWANHGNIADERAATYILRRARSLDRMKGDLE